MESEEGNFEQPLVELRQRIEELEGYPEGSGHSSELERLRSALKKTTALGIALELFDPLAQLDERLFEVALFALHRARQLAEGVGVVNRRRERGALPLMR